MAGALSKGLIYGRGDRIRTCDPMLPKHVRYQLRYTSIA